jgi:predicted AAA+ superfamily ATPase
MAKPATRDGCSGDQSCLLALWRSMLGCIPRSPTGGRISFHFSLELVITATDYLAWFEDAYCFFTVQIFDSSPTRRNANPKKVYCIDHAWFVSTSSGILVNSGHLLENLVFTALRRRHRAIYYYKTRTGKEVDFVVLQDKRNRALIQACETLQEPQTRKREVAALEEAMKELHLKSALIVTRNEEQQIASDHGRISVVPIWRFLLETEVTGPA